jgi:hypothetical protein
MYWHEISNKGTNDDNAFANGANDFTTSTFLELTFIAHASGLKNAKRTSSNCRINISTKGQGCFPEKETEQTTIIRLKLVL